MSDHLLMYFLLKLDEIRSLFYFEPALIVFLSIICILLMLVISIAIDLSKGIDPPLETFRKFLYFLKFKIKYIIYGLIFIVISNSISILLPSTKDIVLIYFVPRIIKSETFKSLSDIDPKLAKLIQLKINSWIGEYDLDLNKDNKIRK
ncbi:MAG: hypothetical protein KatS3mg002_0391 [Candidatus Woesearchaeota archaeon]|nr:MAG: hypothetical protein KatS3mg002_0391 [Candidatus Woesearchaeota archaeon]